MDKPTVEQTAWVLEKLIEHMEHGGSFRYLIYDRMGYPTGKTYALLYPYGMTLSNAFHDLAAYRKKYGEIDALD